jgi:hypothetical protein
VFLGRTAAITEAATQLTPAGQGNLRKHRQGREIDGQGFEPDGVGGVRLVECAFEEPFHFEQEQADLPDLRGIAVQPVQELGDAFAGEQGLEHADPGGIEFLRLVRPFDEQPIRGAHKDERPDARDEFIDPGEVGQSRGGARGLEGPRCFEGGGV